ncbi:MAG: hypothetical protein Q9218_007583, partial [Villophora microphyllina]
MDNIETIVETMQGASLGGELLLSVDFGESISISGTASPSARIHENPQPLLDNDFSEDGGVSLAVPSKGKKKRKNHRAGKKKKQSNTQQCPNQSGEEEMIGEEKTTEVKCYAMRTSPGKRNGLFATQPIPRGSRIIREQPLVHLAGGKELLLIPTIFAKLSASDQDRFLSLQYVHPQNLADNACFNSLLQIQADKISMSVNEQWKLIGRCQPNAFETPNNGIAIGIEFARLNHSCTPNITHQWNRNIGCITVHAIRDIEAGEELLASSIPLLEKRDVRRERTMELGFTCTCATCENPTKASEYRRKWLSVIDQTLNGGGKVQTDEDALSLCIEAVKLMEEEGLTDMALTNFYRRAGQTAAALGRWTGAFVWARKMMDTRACCGEDHPIYKVNEKDLQDLTLLRDCAKKTMAS